MFLFLLWVAAGAAAAVVIAVLAARLLHKSVWAAVGQLLATAGALGRALLPLALPFLVIAIFATREASHILPVLVGAALAALIWLFARGEGEFEHERSQLLALPPRIRGGLAKGSRVSSLAHSGLPWTAIGLLGGAVFLFLAGFAGQFAAWDSLAGASGLAEYLALLLLAITLPLRLFGYATNAYRYASAGALTLLIGQVLVVAGVFPSGEFLRSIHLDLGWASIGLVVILVGVLLAEALRVQTPIVPGPFHQGARAWGLAAASLAALGLFAALVIATIETTGGADRLGSLRAALSPTIVNTRGGPDARLVWTFAPLLHLEHDEQWGPSSVGPFLAGATESGAQSISGLSGKLSLATLPTVCPDGSHQACGTLRCPSCAEETTTQRNGFFPQGSLYARVVHRATDPQAFAGWNPWGARLTTLIQYWIFYLYDRWQAETVIGKLTQEHQGDWEFVAVGLAQDRPLFLALSEHCAGQVVDWNRNLPAAPGHLVDGRIIISDHLLSPTDEVTHPIIAVARGSHANYARSGGNRPPDWGSCSNLPSGAVTAFSYASNVRDLTEQGSGGWYAYPRNVSVVKSENGRLGRPFSYPGTWGSGEYVTFGHLNPKRTGAGPKSPPLQGRSWERPINFFFCGPHWQGDHGTTAQCGS